MEMEGSFEKPYDATGVLYFYGAIESALPGKIVGLHGTYKELMDGLAEIHWQVVKEYAKWEPSDSMRKVLLQTKRKATGRFIIVARLNHTKFLNFQDVWFQEPQNFEWNVDAWVIEGETELPSPRIEAMRKEIDWRHERYFGFRILYSKEEKRNVFGLPEVLVDPFAPTPPKTDSDIPPDSECASEPEAPEPAATTSLEVA